MKHLKLFESFQKGLTSKQSDNLSELFFDFLLQRDIDADEAREYFKPGSQNFANFLLHLEDETNWFDYTQTESIISEISDILDEIDEVESDEFDDDEFELEEIEEGDYVDFVGYGKLYVVAILGDGYLVNEDEEQRWMGENGDGFIIPWSKIEDFSILEKGSGFDEF